MIVEDASKISSKINLSRNWDNTVSYDYTLIIGDFILKEGSFASKITFKKCIFKDDIKFSNCRFKENLEFIDTYFEGDLSFKNVICEKRARFNSCQFGPFSLAYIDNSTKRFEIKQSQFKDEAEFSCKFYVKPNFDHVTFEKYACFHSEFLLSVFFFNCIFMNHAGFEYSRFRDCALFFETRFLGEANFERAEFGKNIGREYLFRNVNRAVPSKTIENFDFSGSLFEEDANFYKAKFFGNAIFKDSRFQETCNFLGARFVGDLDFHGAVFDSFAKFGAGSKIFGNADFSETVFNSGAYLHDLEFGGKFKLARSKIDNFMIRWDAIKNNLEDNWQFNGGMVRLVEDFDKSIVPLYLSLIRNFRNLGFHDDADECYLELRKKQKKNIKGFKSKVMDYLDYLFFGYGVKWKNPLLVGLITVTIFTPLYYIFDNHFLIDNHTALWNATIENNLLAFISTPNTSNIHIIIFLSLLERLLGYVIMSCFLVTLAKNRLR